MTLIKVLSHFITDFYICFEMCVHYQKYVIYLLVQIKFWKYLVY